ncbi:hypothetical protein OKW21_002238 [Catalinimonas alkaloidigena]|nr:hypothetical protein [Catalinimonas alkaloidigena]
MLYIQLTNHWRFYWTWNELSEEISENQVVTPSFLELK